MTTRKKIIVSVVGLLSIGLGLFLYGGWKMFGDEINAIRSLRMVGDKVYTFTFKGDYGFKAFLEQGGSKTDADMARYIATFLSKGYVDIPSPEQVQVDAGCTSLYSSSAVGRNFDFKNEGQSVVIIKTEPEDGYKSLSTSTFAFLGNAPDWHPVAGMDGFLALAATYIPLDGMNEKGVCVADLVEIDGDTAPFDTERPDLTIVAAIRLVLDYAASVDEAIALLEKYDIHPSIGTAHHLAISDSSRSVVVEWMKDQMFVTETSAVTNHCLWESRQNAMTGESQRRLELIRNLPSANPEEVLSAMKRTSYENETIWTAIFDRVSMRGTWYLHCNWDAPVEFGI